MEDKLRAYMDDVFKNIKPTKKSVEMKEEILQNLIDKYRDLLNEGKAPEAAYNIAIASIGDMDDLLAGFRQSNNQPYLNEVSESARKKSAILIAIAVMLYITSVIPPIITSYLSDNGFFGEVLGPCFMFIMIAAATGLIIYNAMTKPRYQKIDDTIVEEFKEWQSQNDASLRAMKSIKSALWAVITLLYIVISFTTGAWHISWVIFLVGVAIEKIIQAVFDLRKQG